MGHGRGLTKENFSRWTSIDADRMASAVHDVYSRSFNVRATDLRKRFFPRDIHVGWTPPLAASTDVTPYGASEGITFFGTSLTRTNPERAKGYIVAGMRTAHGTGLGFHHIARTWIYTSAPAILDFLSVGLFVDHPLAAPPAAGYVNDFAYDAGGPGPPLGKTAGEPTDDVVIQVAIPSELETEFRRFDAMLINLSPMSPARHKVSQNTTTVPSEGPTVSRSFPAGELHGGWYSVHDLGLPVPAESRIRLDLMLPQYDPVLTNLGPWGTFPTGTCIPDLHATLLYELEG